MRSHKIFINLVSNFFMQICAIFAGIVIPQIILKNFGSEINGFTSSINQFLGYFSLVEGGIGAASILALYKPFAENDKEKIKNIYYSTSVYLNKAGIIYLFLLVFLVILYPNIVSSGISDFLIVSITMIIGFGKMLELSVLGRYRIILTAGQNIGVYAAIQILGYIFTILAALISAKLQLGIVVMQVIIGLVCILKIILLNTICKKMYGSIICNKVQKGAKRLTIPQQTSALVHQLASMVSYNTDVIVLTFAATLTEVSIYSVYTLIFNGLQSLLAAFQNVIAPAFGDIISRNEEETLEEVFSIYEFLYYLMTSLIAIGVVLMIKPFIKLYTKGVVDVQYWDSNIAVFFLIIFILNNFRLPGSVLINAAGHLKQTQNFFIFEAAANLVISIVLVKPLGILGCLIGTLFSGVCRLFFVIIYPYFKIYKFSMKTFIKRIGYNCLMIGIAYKFSDIFEEKIYNWLDFFKYGILVVLIIMLIQIIFIWILDRKDLNNILHKMKNMVKGEKKR